MRLSFANHHTNATVLSNETYKSQKYRLKFFFLSVVPEGSIGRLRLRRAYRREQLQHVLADTSREEDVRGPRQQREGQADADTTVAASGEAVALRALADHRMEGTQPDALLTQKAQGQAEEAPAQTQKLLGQASEHEAQTEAQKSEEPQKEATPSEVEEKTHKRNDHHDGGDVGRVHDVHHVDHD